MYFLEDEKKLMKMTSDEISSQSTSRMRGERTEAQN